MTKVITFANQKGGSGKSLAANLFAGILTERGYKVLIVDCDEQAGNISSDFGADKSLPGLAQAIQKRKDPSFDVRSIIQSVNDIDILVGSKELATVITELKTNPVGSESVLKRVLKPVMSGYDYVICDTAAGFSPISLAALTMTNDVLIPVRANMSSASGAKQIIDVVNEIKDAYNEDLTIAGVFLNDYNKQTLVHQDFADVVGAICKQEQVKFMSARLRHSTNADKLTSYAYKPSELVKGSVARGLIRDAYELVDEYLSESEV